MRTVPAADKVTGLIPRYYLFRMTNTSGFFLPVAILILHDKGFGLDFIGIAYAVYGFAKLFWEIPTGYLGDWLGRRASLALGSGIRAIVIGVYPFIGTEVVYLGLHVLWAAGRAFRSGTQDAWLYEILQARFDETDFVRIESRGNTLKLLTDATTAIAGGVLYTVNPAYPFVGTAAIALIGIPLVLSFPSISDLSTTDSDAAVDDEEPTLTVTKALEVLHVQVRRPKIRWFVLYAAVFYALFVVTRIYEQPALESVGVPVAGFGVLYAGFKLFSAGVASTVGSIHARIGTKGVMGCLIPAYAVAYAGILVAPIAVVPVLFINRGLRTMTGPVTHQYLNRRIDDLGRATVLSGASMALALVGSGARVVAGRGTELLGPVTFLAGAGIALPTIGALLWMFVPQVRPPTPSDTGRPDEIATGD